MKGTFVSNRLNEYDRLASLSSPWRRPISKRLCRQMVVGVLSVLFAISAVINTRAADYPDRAVRIIIPFGAGGAGDTILRIVSKHLNEKWNQPVVVDNRAGSNAIVGTLAAAKSAADGYTLLFGSDQNITINPALYVLPYSADKDFVPITLMGAIPHILAVHKDVPAKTVGEFIDLAKLRPGQMMYGSAGPGSPQRLAMEYFSRLAGIELVHVPYKGANELTMGVVGGQVPVFFNGINNIMPHLQSGALRALAISTMRRSPLLPELPTVDESGVPTYSSQGWLGILAPTGAPQAVLDKVQADITEILKRPDVRNRLEELGFLVYASSTEEFAKFLADETAKWRKVVKEANIQAK